MGYTWACDMAVHAGLEKGIEYHLKGNCYPPIFDDDLARACVRAVRNVAKGDNDKRVRLPTGWEWKGKKLAPSYEVVDAFRLYAFVDVLTNGGEDEDEVEWEDEDED